ncbi:TIGR00645 family protein [Dankookia rubra]|uniref:TIGR00645 family protein n=1 Tax=Dankookia rubra TaxID=1442381 RepID=UPI00140D26EC|nr:TIGR00645 family protein [Dankookia rubra]
MRLLARVILASRYLLAFFFIGLIASLGLYAVRFGAKLWKLAQGVTEMAEDDFLIAVLHLVDAALIASLIVIVALASFDSLVARLNRDEADDDLRWVSSTDHSNLKIKVATAIVAISSIHLLQVFLKVESYPETAVFWQVVIHTVFVVGTVLLGLQDWIGRQARNERQDAGKAG